MAAKVAPEVEALETRVIRALRDANGVMSPSMLSARLLVPRDELQQVLHQLADKGMVIERSDRSTVDGRLLILTVLGRSGVKRLA